MVARADECRPEWLDADTIDALRDDQRETLAAHLDHCPRCRQLLDRNTERSDWWSETRSLLIESSAAALAPTSASLDLSAVAAGHRSFESDAHEGGRVARYELGFLDKSERPEAIGRIDHYEVLGVLGRGGMGIVLKAHDPALDRMVAIKVLAPAIASQGVARQRFIREAQAAAAIAHPHVIAIHAVAPRHEPPYFVMPLVAGESLQRRIDLNGALPIDEAIRIAHQVAEGLAAAHERGLIHRDVKPANILLEGGTDRVVLTDFGLARAIDDASLTCTGLIAGTPPFMAPEQARGEPLDARSDLFSLGSVLYAMLAGRPPFRAESTFGMLRKIAEQTAEPLHQANPTVPAWLERLVARLMTKDRRQRYATARALASDLCAASAHLRQPRSSPLPTHLRTPAWLARVDRRVLLSTGLALSLLVVLTPLAWSTFGAGGVERSNEREEIEATATGSVPASRPPVTDGELPSQAKPLDWLDGLDETLPELDERLRRLELREQIRIGSPR